MTALSLDTNPLHDTERLNIEGTTDLIMRRGGHYPRWVVKMIVEAVDRCSQTFKFSARIVMAQMLHETGWFTYTGDVRWWQFNFAGMGATGGVLGHIFAMWNGPAPSRAEIETMSVTEILGRMNLVDTIQTSVAAVFAHHYLYNVGTVEKWPVELRRYVVLDPRYIAAVSKGFAGKITKLSEYRGNWAVPGTFYPERLLAVAEILPIQKGERALKLVFGAGHHNTSGGNQDEHRLVSELTEEYIRVGKALGHDVRSMTPDGPDADSDPGDGEYSGDLFNAALQTVQWAGQGWVADYIIEVHFQGLKYGSDAGRGHFIIYPDWGDDVDTDVRDAFGTAWAKKFHQTTAMPIYGNGTMSEKRTGVGGQGFRLGFFRATEPLRQSTTRAIIEHGSHTSPADLAIITQPDFNRKAVEAFYRTLHEVTGLPAPTTYTPSPPVIVEPATPSGPTLTSNDFFIVDEMAWKIHHLGEHWFSVLGPAMSGMFVGPVDGVNRLVQIFEKAVLAAYPPHLPHGVPYSNQMYVRNILPRERDEVIKWAEDNGFIRKGSV